MKYLKFRGSLFRKSLTYVRTHLNTRFGMLALYLELHLAWQIRVTAKMLNLFLTLKMVMFLTGFDPKTDPYIHVVKHSIEVNVTDIN